MIPKGMTIKEYFSRRGARKLKREQKRLELGLTVLRQKTKKRQKMPARKRLVKELDRLFSLLVRDRDSKANGGLCVFGCGRPVECCFHFVTRSKHSVRWDFKNAVGSCMIQNYENEFNPHQFVMWYIKKYGLQEYESLLRRSSILVKRSRIDLMEMVRDFEARLASIQEI